MPATAIPFLQGSHLWLALLRGCRSVFQVTAQLLAASALSSAYQPFGVLSDLRDEWHIFWLDGKIMYQYTAPSRSAGVGFIQGMLEKVSSPSPVRERAGIILICGNVRAVHW